MYINVLIALISENICQKQNGNMYKNQRLGTEVYLLVDRLSYKQPKPGCISPKLCDAFHLFII